MKRDGGGVDLLRMIYIYIFFLFMSVCFNFFSFTVFNKRGDLGVHAHYYFPPILATNTQVCLCVSVSVCASLYIHVLLYESVFVCECVYHGRPLNCKGKSWR